MSGWPYDTGSSFVRHPAGYAHDAFGHVGADDAGVREACFRKIPHTGIDISPKVKGDTSARVVSPIFGTIVAAGFDPEAGRWHIIKHDLYAEWWILGHHAAFAKSAGHVDRGDHIANMGMSGGAKGVHTHISVATSLAAAQKQITGYISYRNGRSIGQWAAYEGLVDPWPLIEREWNDEQRRREAAAWHAANDARKQAEAEAAAAAQREEDEIMSAAEEIKDVVRRESRPRLYELTTTGELMLAEIKTGYQMGPWDPKKEPGKLASLIANGYNLVTQSEADNRQRVDEIRWNSIQREVDNQLRRIARATADEITSRGFISR